MKLFAILTCAWTALMLRPALGAGEPALKLDAGAAVRFACARSPELSALRARVVSARMAAGDKWRDFLPMASVQYSEDDMVTIGERDERNRQVMLSLSYDIHTGGVTVDEYGIAGLEHLAARERYRMERAALVLGVKKEYYGIQGAEGDVNIQRTLLENLKMQRKIIDEEARQGMATELQRVQADARIAEAEYELLRAENTYRAGMKGFRLLVGVPPGREIILEPATDAAGPLSESRDGKAGLTALALRARAEVRLAECEAHRARAGLRIAGRYYMPVIRLTGSYGYRGERFPLDNRVWSVGVAVSTSLFGTSMSDTRGYGEGGYGDGRSMSHNVQAGLYDDPAYARRAADAESALRESLKGLEQARARVVLEVDRAHDRIRETAELVRLARVNAGLLERQAAIEDARARVGDLARYEVLRTYVELSKARLRVHAAVAEHRIALAELEAASGNDREGASGEHEDH